MKPCLESEHTPAECVAVYKLCLCAVVNSRFLLTAVS